MRSQSAGSLFYFMAHQVGKLIWPRKANAYTISLFPTQTMAFFLYLRIESNKQKWNGTRKCSSQSFPHLPSVCRKADIRSVSTSSWCRSRSRQRLTHSHLFLPYEQRPRGKNDAKNRTSHFWQPSLMVTYGGFSSPLSIAGNGVGMLAGGYLADTIFDSAYPITNTTTGPKIGTIVCVYVCVNGGRSSSAPSDDSIALPNRPATGSEAAGMLGMLVRLKRAAGDSVCREVSNVRDPPCAIWCLRDPLCKAVWVQV